MFLSLVILSEFTSAHTHTPQKAAISRTAHHVFIVLCIAAIDQQTSLAEQKSKSDSVSVSASLTVVFLSIFVSIPSSLTVLTSLLFHLLVIFSEPSVGRKSYPGPSHFIHVCLVPRRRCVSCAAVHAYQSCACCLPVTLAPAVSGWYWLRLLPLKVTHFLLA